MMIGYLQSNTGVQKKVKIGFSWTTLLFGLFVPLFRKDIKWAAIMFLVALASGALTGGALIIPANIIFSFMYNKLYIKGLIDKGYLPVGNDFADILRKNNVVFDNFIQMQGDMNTYTNNDSVFDLIFRRCYV